MTPTMISANIKCFMLLTYCKETTSVTIFTLHLNFTLHYVKGHIEKMIHIHIFICGNVIMCNLCSDDYNFILINYTNVSVMFVMIIQVQVSFFSVVCVIVC